MEVPKIIWLSPNEYRSNESSCFWSESQRTDYDIEYVRKDAFIDKACEWLSKVSIEDMHYQYNDFDTSEDWYKFIEDFRKYIKVE